MSPDHPTASTLGELFLWRCENFPDSLAYAFVANDLQVSASLTYAELLVKCRDAAQAIQSMTAPGDRILVALPNSLETAVLFWATILSGRIPVPSPAPDRTHSRVNFSRLITIARDAEIKLMVVDSSSDHLDTLKTGQWDIEDASTIIDRSTAVPNQGLLEFDRPEADLAYLQYTSGSTLTPRGVEISHLNVLAQCAALGTLVNAVEPDEFRSLTWLPWYHDYGLMHGVIAPVFTGAPSYLMDTMTFLRRPLRWLEAIEKLRISHSGAPNFAYAACTAAIKRQANWNANLTCWAVATCGAEPIRAATVRDFLSTFTQFGFIENSFCPAYGLAEAVLVVSSNTGAEKPKIITVLRERLEQGLAEIVQDHNESESLELVSCGKPIDGLQVSIVNPLSQKKCANLRIGEIWVSGSSVARGYWCRELDSEATFANSIAGENEPFLKTGDLGFLDSDGQLYITGRLKDLIIIHGRNIYPQDIEQSAENSHLRVRNNGVVAFSVSRQDQERLALVVECVKTPAPDEVKDIVRTIRQIISRVFDIEVFDIVPVQSGSIPRTSSGKLQRGLARSLYEKNEFDRLPNEDKANTRSGLASDEISSKIELFWGDLLGPDSVSQRTDFFVAGGDSLLATQLVSRINAELNLQVPIRTVFECPSIAGLTDVVRRYLAQPSEKASQAPGSDSANESTLSYSQERIWFMHQLLPDSSAYNVPLAVRLTGKLNKTALAQACQILLSRHDILRTSFHTENLIPQPVVDSTCSIGISLHEAYGKNENEITNALLNLLTGPCAAPFSLESAPLIRIHLIATGANEHVLLLVMHHIITDQWSLSLLGQELASVYSSIVQGQNPDESQLGLQYREIASWHRNWINSQRIDVELDYWKEKLSGLVPTELTPDRARPTIQSSAGATVRRPFSASNFRVLSSCSAKSKASLSMLLLTALNILLHRYTAQTDITLGMPIANRHQIDFERVVGTFVNTLVIRNDVSGNPTFSQLLERVRDTALEAYAHQDMPFELLVEKLNVPRDSSRSPLFGILFNVINAPTGNIHFDGLSWSRLDFDRGAAQFDLTVSIDPQFDHSVVFEYATALFERNTIERLADAYIDLLELVPKYLNSRLSELPSMPSTERERINEFSNGPSIPLTSTNLVQSLSNSLGSRLDSIAVVAVDDTLSYSELFSNACKFALKLQARGIQPGDRVGLCLPRDSRLLSSLIGTTIAGCVFVPLDPDYPPNRLNYILEDSRPAIIVTTSSFSSSQFLNNSNLLLLDEENDAVDPISTVTVSAFLQQCQKSILPTSPAYIIYTSGSTGMPKGVEVPHEAVVNFLESMARTPGLAASDTLLAVTTLSFDISILELFLPLTTGATIVLAGDEQRTDVTRLASMLIQHEVSVMQATPTLWQLLVDRAADTLPNKILVGGEPLPHSLARSLKACGRELWNMYGPTETTVWSSCSRVDATKISIGSPIQNTEILILDQQRQLSPMGAPGEIAIAGKGLALGYFRNEFLTEERFIDHPFVAGSRIYRTGDIGRWLNSGELEHLGRSDSQVKVRGHRIELGEIEARLSRHQSVRQALAIIFELLDEPRIAAFLIGDKDLDIDQVRSYAELWLPTYMCPQYFVLLDAKPLLPNGKTDTRQLLELLESHTQAHRTVVAPRTELEHATWRIWANLLGTEEFGVTDSFFDLGGHSIMAITMIEQFRSISNSETPLAFAFQHPTISALCKSAEQREPESSIVRLVTTANAQVSLYCLCGIELYKPLADALSPDVEALGIFLPDETLSGADLEHARQSRLSVEKIAERYVSEIRQFQPTGPYHLAGISFGALLAYEAAQQLERQGEKVDFLAILDYKLPTKWMRLQRWLTQLPNHFKQLISPAEQPQSATQDTRQIDPNEFAFPTGHNSYESAMFEYRPRPLQRRAVLVQATDVHRFNSNYGWKPFIPELITYQIHDDHLGILSGKSVTELAHFLRDNIHAKDSDLHGITEL